MTPTSKALLLILLSIFLGHASYPPMPLQRVSLAKTVGRCRPIEGRIIGGFEYASYLTPVPISAKDSLALLKNRIKRRAENTKEPWAIADKALLALFEPRLKLPSINHSINLMDQVSKDLPRETNLLNDLSALLIARGTLKQEMHDFVLAVEFSSKAIAGNTRLAEAYFNRAIALEHLFLEGAACKDWNRYLQIDPESRWADEARSRCRRSRPVPVGWEHARSQLDLAASGDDHARVKQLVREFPRHVRLHAQEKLLGAWAVALSKGDGPDANRFLRTARAIGMVLKQDSGDHMVLQATSEISAALENSDGGKLEALVRGHRFYAEGLKFRDDDQDEKALVSFEQSSISLGSANSSFRFRAQLEVIRCSYYMGQYESSLEALRVLASRVGTMYPILIGEILWLQGLSYSKLANFSAAYEVYLQADEIFSSVGEADRVAFLSFLKAENLRYQGQSKLAWYHLYEALKTIRTMGRSQWYHNSLLDSAELALSEGLPNAALMFQDEMAEGALARKDPILIAESFLRRSRTHHRLGSPGLAIEDLAEAKEWSYKVASRVRKDLLQSDIAMMRSEIQRSTGDYVAAIESLSSAIAEATQNDRMFRLPDLYEARGATYQEVDELRLAEKDFRQAVIELSKQREMLTEQELRASHFERSQRVFGELIQLQTRQGNAKGAFHLAEEARGRGLLDVLAATRLPLNAPGASPEILAEHDIRERLPTGVVVLEYSVFKDRILIFVLTRDTFELVEVSQEMEALRRKVERYVGAIRGSNPQLHGSLAREMYDLLIPSARAWTGQVNLMILVPDKFLFSVPFAALVNPRNGKYLIEETAVALSPSANAYVELLGRELALRLKPSMPRLLIVSDPIFDRTRLSDLTRLRGAQAEANSLATLGEVDLLAGSEATPKKFIERAPYYQFIHVASHSRLNAEFPLQSALIFAPEKEGPEAEPGMLLAGDIYRLRFENTRLLVLAACEGARGQISGEGVSSLGRSFLAAGVPAVIASLWKMDDRLASELFLELHEGLRGGLSTANALRRAQLGFIKRSSKSQSEPLLWGGVHIFGGVSP